ncbi:MAG: hypothetical protein ACLQVD_08795 [Capsulimonadaceae bacterium]
MLNKRNIRTMLLVPSVAAAAAALAWAQSAPTLQFNGAVVSHNLQIVNGVPYVPLSDVARILGGTATKTADGYQINLPTAATPAGGANPVAGMSGKIGTTVFTGKWRFKVAGVTRVPQFQTQYEPTSETIIPTGTNDEVVVVACLIKNAQTQPRQLGLRTGNMYNTALTDDQGQSYPPTHFDFPGGSGYGPSMLPGAACSFNALFCVPKGTHLKDLVFSLWSYEHNVPDDVRISLAP